MGGRGRETSEPDSIAGPCNLTLEMDIVQEGMGFREATHSPSAGAGDAGGAVVVASFPFFLTVGRGGMAVKGGKR